MQQDQNRKSMQKVLVNRGQNLLLVLVAIGCFTLGVHFLRACHCTEQVAHKGTSSLLDNANFVRLKSVNAEGGLPDIPESQADAEAMQDTGGDDQGPTVDVSNDGMTEIVINSVRHIKRKNCTSVAFSQYPLPKTALASFPGAGNTWARHLIQLASGVYTGGIYYDPGLYEKGFKAEANQNASVIAIKTHYPRFPCCENLKYERVVLLLRNPEPCIQSEFTLLRTKYNHTGHINKTKINVSGWPKYLKDNSDLWLDFQNFWLNYTKEQDISIFLLFYEDMTSSLEKTVSRLVDFLGVRLSTTDAQCVFKHGEGPVHRKYLPGESPFEAVEVDRDDLNSKVTKINQKIKQCLSSGRCQSSGREAL